MKLLSFDAPPLLITGAGGGLGRAFAGRGGAARMEPDPHRRRLALEPRVLRDDDVRRRRVDSARRISVPAATRNRCLPRFPRMTSESAGS